MVRKNLNDAIESLERAQTHAGVGTRLMITSAIEDIRSVKNRLDRTASDTEDT